MREDGDWLLAEDADHACGMSKTKHTEAQIIAALKQVEAGRKAEDMARERSVFKQTIYACKRPGASDFDDFS